MLLQLPHEKGQLCREHCNRPRQDQGDIPRSTMHPKLRSAASAGKPQTWATIHTQWRSHPQQVQACCSSSPGKCTSRLGSARACAPPGHPRDPGWTPGHQCWLGQDRDILPQGAGTLFLMPVSACRCLSMSLPSSLLCHLLTDFGRADYGEHPAATFRLVYKSCPAVLGA